MADRRSGACVRVGARDGAPDLQAARPVSNTAVFCAVESRILRSFQRYRRCLDRSTGTADPRVAVRRPDFGQERCRR